VIVWVLAWMLTISQALHLKRMLKAMKESELMDPETTKTTPSQTSKDKLQPRGKQHRTTESSVKDTRVSPMQHLLPSSLNERIGVTAQDLCT
jgi:hypothetical protein